MTTSSLRWVICLAFSGFSLAYLGLQPALALDILRPVKAPLNKVSNWWQDHRPEPEEEAEPEAATVAGGAAPVPLLRLSYIPPQQPVPIEGLDEVLSPQLQWARVPQPIQAELLQVMRRHNPSLSSERAQQLALAIIHSSIANQVDYRLLASVMAVESSYRTEVISSSGALGLGQFLPATARYMKVANPFDPMDNALGLGRYVSYLLKKFDGDTAKAIGSYYVGPGTVSRQGLTEPAQQYVGRVEAVLGQFVEAREAAETLQASNSSAPSALSAPLRGRPRSGLQPGT